MMAKIARLDHAFSDVFEREANPVEGHEKEKKERQKKKINEKPEDVGHFLIQILIILVCAHARAKMW